VACICGGVFLGEGEGKKVVLSEWVGSVDLGSVDLGLEDEGAGRGGRRREK